MISKTIEYTDYNGNEVKDTFYFNLNEAEIIDMEMSKSGGLSEHIQKIIDTKDLPKLIKLFKTMLLKSYGEVSDDGKHFVKSKKIRKKFENSAAFPKLYMALATNDIEAAEFVKGIIPQNIDMTKLAG
ncbi:hypothetical protein [Ileibacterium valens]|uniref:Uncharacterized protein n=1 Tax=Ileibacterium valens TaxID=1862668 RepID=A0A1U7NHP7_9FIRM|nr:hypothetical protein [Ileibacterium valens]OLU39740.1 hypothetical protein BO224_06845 [Erysipelotrichaceae bacterium NYU-BL-E8]OLU39980.1 hypothetical protein BM735_06455 [Erysipelotrichaceae bacterium NYU-BL-F16]OLU41307.1 hypothetical protein BO222_03545 [Ileibacterium valens]